MKKIEFSYGLGLLLVFVALGLVFLVSYVYGQSEIRCQPNSTQCLGYLYSNSNMTNSSSSSPFIVPNSTSNNTENHYWY